MDYNEIQPDPGEYRPNCKYILWDDINTQIENGNITILCLNARSLPSKFSEIEAHLIKSNKNKDKFYHHS